jgi:hypothetical protein
LISCGHATGDDDQHLLALEPGQRPAHRFDGQPEIVGDVLPAHRQRDGLAGIADLREALAPGDKKGRDLLFGRAAAEQQHLLLRLRQFARGEFVHAHQQLRPRADELRKHLGRKAARRHRVDGVDRERVALADRKPEKIPRQGKADDLPPPVGQKLVKARDTGDDVMNRLRLLAGGEQRLVRGEVNMPAHPLEFEQISLIEHAADRQGAAGAGQAAAETGPHYVAKVIAYHEPSC